jgi:hypothetical protein
MFANLFCSPTVETLPVDAPVVDVPESTPAPEKKINVQVLDDAKRDQVEIEKVTSVLTTKTMSMTKPINRGIIMDESEETKIELEKVTSKLAMIEKDMSVSGTSFAEVVKRGDKFSLVENGEDQSSMSISNLELVLPNEEPIDDEKDLKTNSTLDTFSSSSPNNSADEININNDEPLMGDDDDDEFNILYKSASMKQEQIGKHIKNSKTRVSWSFQRGDGFDTIPHLVSMSWSKGSGRVLIHLDGKEILETKILKSKNPFFIHKWDTEDGLSMQIIAAQKVTSILILKNHDLTVNGTRFDNFPDLVGLDEKDEEEVESNGSHN